MNKKYAIHFGPAPSKTPQSTENAHSTTVASILVELTALASLETTLTGNRWVDGILNDDSDHPYDVSLEIEITEEQYNQIIEQIEEDRANPPDYDLNDCNCTDYVLDLLEEIGIVIDSEPTDFPWPFDGDGRNPGNLGEDLVEDYGGERNEDGSSDENGSSKN